MAALETTEDEVDYLDEDAPIPGQNYCCLSFISPEKVLQQKDRFIMKKFIKAFENEEGDLVIKHSEFDSKYEDFVTQHNEKLEQDFQKEVGFQTSVRGVKIRGIYNTYDEAAKRAHAIQKLDRSFHIFVARVGVWLSWDPSADDIQDQEYLEKELNELMKNYKSNQVQRDVFYASQVEEHKRNAAAESKKRQEEAQAAAATEEDETKAESKAEDGVGVPEEKSSAPTPPPN